MTTSHCVYVFLSYGLAIFLDQMLIALYFFFVVWDASFDYEIY
jgi:hypothetical protein